ncbi:unnamed protein product [Caenorhabditis brenneri]
MAEYLKNKPIALRHCFLYLFLQKSSVEKAFTEFCEVFGKDAITEEELNFWFDKFKNGLFDIEKDKKPITDMKDILRSDKYALRACIFYDSLKLKHPEFEENDEFIHHPVFSVYMHFCKVIGDDVIDYQEFDFWFYRFFNGEFDSDSRRGENKKPCELENMPLDIMKNVVEYLDIIDRVSLERTSQSLRLFSQDQKVFQPFLKLDVFDDSVYISFGKEDHQIDQIIQYKNEGNDCVKTYRGVRVLRDVSSLKIALQNFKKILGNPKLYVKTLFIISWCERCIEDALKFTHLLHVQHLSLSTHSMRTLLNILPSLTPGYLTTITIDINSEKAVIGKTVEMDQWKQAKYLDMGISQFIGPLRHLYDFKEFTIGREELFIDDVREMKEILLKSPDFQKCDLVVRKSIDPNLILQVFGGPIEGSIDTCHYPTPNSTEYFEIIVNKDFMKIERLKK